MTAEEYFHWVRDSARELATLRASAAMVTAGQDPARGGGHFVATRSPGAADPIGAIVAAMVDAEDRARSERARLERVVDHGRFVIWKVGMAMGPTVAAVLTAHYVDLYDLGVMSMDLHLSMKTLYRMRKRAFEYVDCVGLVKDDHNLPL